MAQAPAASSEPRASATAAEAGAELTPTIRSAFAAFQRDAGGQWLLRSHAATGTPAAIFGHGLALTDWRGNSLEEARRHAHATLARWPELLGITFSDCREVIGARMGRTWTFTFAQTFRGVPVVDGHIDVRIHGNGRLCHLGSTAWPLPADFDTTPAIEEAAAIAAAWLGIEREPNRVPQPGRAEPNRLVIRGDAATGPRLCWEIGIRAIDQNGDGPLGRAFVDARTGAFVHFHSDKHECGLSGCRSRLGPRAEPGDAAAPVPTTFTVRGWTLTAFSPLSTPTNVPLAGVDVQVPGVGNYITDQNGQFVADLTSPVTVQLQLRGEHLRQVQGNNALIAAATLQPGVPATLQFGSQTSSSQELAHTTTYLWTDRINRWARGILGNTPQLDTADQVQPTVNINSSCNAFYFGNSINFYAAGGGCTNTAAASVIAHEWGHGLDDRYGGISQVNGLSEGWGDVCSAYLLDDPEIGHDFFVGGGGIRNANNNHQYPGGSGPHAQGQSWMGFAWKFRQNLRTQLGGPQAIAISNDVVLGSIAANASNQADAVIAAFQADDDDGQLGNGTPHYNQLVAACQVHNLPYPTLIPGYIEHTPLTLTTNQNLPRRIEVNTVTFSGSYTQVRALWNDGQPRQQLLVQTGTAGFWHGMLPGQLAPQVFAYHIEAQHSSGVTHRLPLTGQYSFSTVAERRIWIDDFEGSVAGWTHGATAGVDDWQLGVPNATAGAGWNDPGTAASGQRCAGTDLGVGSDGAYSGGSEMWLRSPPIDCTGQTGVRLRWRRWISCAGPNDRVEVRVGGTLVWLSSFTPIADTSWSTTDTLVANAADNNPAVVVEFRLVSDAVTHWGGWNIDDVELYSLGYAVPLPATLALQPAQATQGSSVTIRIDTSGPQPFLLVLGDTAGPTLIPNLPQLAVGGGLIPLFGGTAANGQYTASFAVPPMPIGGQFFHSQAMTISGSSVVTSNRWLNRFTP